MFYRLFLLLDCRELPIRDSVAKEATQQDWNFIGVPHFSKIKPEMLLLDDHSGHHLAESLHHDLGSQLLSAVHDFASSSCTSWKKGTVVGRGRA